MAANKEAITLSRVHSCCCSIVTCHCVTRLYEIFVYSVLGQIDTTIMHTIIRFFIPYIDGHLGE